MKRYLGDRTIDGVKVTVDDVPLDPRLPLREFSRNGFEWSYEGPSRASSRSRCSPIISATMLPRWRRSNPSCGPWWRISETSGR